MQAKNRAKAKIPPLPETSFIPAKQARGTDASAWNSPRISPLSSSLLVLPVKIWSLGKWTPDQPLWGSRLLSSSQGVKARKTGGGTRASLVNVSKETSARTLCMPERELEESGVQAVQTQANMLVWHRTGFLADGMVQHITDCKKGCKRGLLVFNISITIHYAVIKWRLMITILRSSLISTFHKALLSHFSPTELGNGRSKPWFNSTFEQVKHKGITIACDENVGSETTAIPPVKEGFPLLSLHSCQGLKNLIQHGIRKESPCGAHQVYSRIKITLWQQDIRGSQIQKAVLELPLQNTEEELPDF